MQTKDSKTQKRRLIYDAILALTLLVAGLFALLLFRSCAAVGDTVSVSVDGEMVGEYSLLEDGIYPLNDGTNILVIECGEAYLKDATCPDRICVNRGKISHVGESIICLPNKVVVTVE